jgi:hypothetical protein
MVSQVFFKNTFFENKTKQKKKKIMPRNLNAQKLTGRRRLKRSASTDSGYESENLKKKKKNNNNNNNNTSTNNHIIPSDKTFRLTQLTALLDSSSATISVTNTEQVNIQGKSCSEIDSQVRAVFVALMARREASASKILSDATWRSRIDGTKIKDARMIVAQALDDCSMSFSSADDVFFTDFFRSIEDVYPAEDSVGPKLVRDLQQLAAQNLVAIRKLSKIGRMPRSILHVIRERQQVLLSDKAIVGFSDMSKFYNGLSVLAMSRGTAMTAAARFVQPADETFVPHEMTSRHSSMSSAITNIICGWSGSGKTVAGTRPILRKNLFCLLISASDIFSDINPMTSAIGKLSISSFEHQRHSNTNDRDREAAIALVVAIIRALGHDVSDELYAAVRQCFLTGRVKVMSAMEKLFFAKFGQLADLDADTNREIRISVDEAGSCPVFVRALCSCWTNVRAFLKSLFRVRSNDELFLYVLGTGTEDVMSGAFSCGSSPDNYSVSVVQPGALFATMLWHLSQDGSSVAARQFFSKIFNSLYVRVNCGKNQQFRLRWQIDDLFVFARLVHDNARCAALAIKQLDAFAANIVGKTLQDPRISFDMFTIADLLRSWSVSIAQDFIKLNGLREAATPIDDIGDALLLVMSRATTITGEVREKLIVKYGILVDNARNTAEAANWTKASCRFSIAQSFVAIYMIFQKLGRYGFGIAASDVFEKILADHHALCLRLRPEAIAGRTPLLVKIFSQQNLNNNNNINHQQHNKKIYRFDLIHQLTDHRSAKEQTLLDGQKPLIVAKPSEFFKTHFLPQQKLGSFKNNIPTIFQHNSQIPTWKQIISEGHSAVFVNAPMAPFADVITIIGGDEPTLILTQCKHLQATTRLTKDQQTEEFAKMLTSTKNINTRKLLMDCCRPANNPMKPVKVIAIIVACHEESFVEFSANAGSETINNSLENFTAQKYLIAAFGKTGSQDESIENFGAYDTQSALYPLLHSALLQSHVKSCNQIVNSMTVMQ